MTWDYGCDQSGKRRYPSAHDAAQAVAKTAKRGMKQRPYRCSSCGGWHLTHFMHETRPKDWHKNHPKQGTAR